MKRPILYFWLVLLILLMAVQAGAATYWVNQSASGQNCVQSATDPGPSNSSQTLTQGMACLSAGDTLRIKAGTYREATDSITLPTAASWGAATSILAASGETVILNGWPFDTFNNANGAYVIFKDMIVDGTGISSSPFGYSFTSLGGGSESVTNGPYLGGQGVHHIRFDNMEVRNWTGIAISLNAGVELINSRIHDNGTISNDNCVYATGTDPTDVVIDHNEIYNCAGAGIQLYVGSGSGANAQVSFNKIHNTSTATRWVNGSYVEQACCETRMDGILVATGFDGAKVYGNIIYSVKRSTGTAQGGILVGFNLTGVEVMNNTLWDVSGEGVLWTDVCATFKNNIVYQPAFGTAAIYNGSGGCATFANNLTDGTNPVFMDAAGGNFTLQSGSPAIDAGTTLGAPYNVDYAGISRPQGAGWDIGAYEYGMQPPQPNPAMVLAFAFENGSGSTATDLSGSGNNGTLGSGVDWAGSGQGKYGNALTFSGAGGVTVPNSNSLNLTQYTMEAWIYPTGTPPTDTFAPIINKYDYPTGIGGYWLEFMSAIGDCGAGPVAQAGHGTVVDNSVHVCDTNVILLNRWTYFSSTYDGQNLVFYRNGQRIAAVTPGSAMSPFSGTAPLILGYSVYNEPYLGMIDEVRIYNYPRTQAQIQSDMNTPLVAGGPAPVPGITLSAGSSITGCASCSIKVQSQ